MCNIICVCQVIEFDDGSGSVLRIQPLRTHRDEAIYECTATNSVGEINTSAKLTVLEGKNIHSLKLVLLQDWLHNDFFFQIVYPACDLTVL